MPLTKAKTDILDLNKDTTINGVTIGVGKNNLPFGSSTALGHFSLVANVNGISNTAVGRGVLAFNTSGSNNVGVGTNALTKNTIGEENVAVGEQSLSEQVNGSYNTAVGRYSLLSCDLGASNTAVGYQAASLLPEGEYNTAIGAFSMSTSTVARTNCSALGHLAQVTGDNQVQLGDVATTTYVYGTVQNRSDERDKTEIKDTELGLDFVKALRPVDFKWDIREDYRPEAPKIVNKPTELKEDASDEEKSKYNEEIAAYNAYLVEKNKWAEDAKLSNITHDGSKKRNRFHHGLIAQEVKSVLEAKGIDFGGFQDHKINGGDDVLSIGYDELIAPMIKAIQELSAEVASLKAQLNP